jgi:hypothetical protein
MKIGRYRFFLSLIFSLILIMGLSPAAIAAKDADKDRSLPVRSISPASRIEKERISAYVMPSDTGINSDLRFYPPNGATNIPTTLTFSWEPVIGDTGYDFKLSTDPSFNDIVSSQDGLKENTYTVKNLKPLTIYFWEVKTFTGLNAVNRIVSAFTTIGYATITTLTSSVFPPCGYRIILTATVKDDSGKVAPTGEVTFRMNGEILCTITLSSGKAIFKKSILSSGRYSFSAVYSGGGVLAGSQSADLIQLVDDSAYEGSTPPESNIWIYPDNNSTNLPTTVTFTWGPLSAANATVGYDFKLSTDQSFKNIVSTQDGLTTNSCTEQNLKPFTVYYWKVRGFIPGNITNWVVSTFTTIGFKTTTKLTSSANPSVLGSAITLTATVSEPSGTGTPTGTVTFKEGKNILGTVALDSGTAALSISSLLLGNHVIAAVYDTSGAYAYNTSEPLTQMINGYTTTTALTSSENPSVDGQSVTLTATVTENSGLRTSYGRVIFYMNGEILETVTLSSEKATLTTSALASGSYTFSAFYPDTGDYAASRSSDLTQVVNTAASGLRVITLFGIGILGVMAGLALFLFVRTRSQKLR